MIQEWIGQPMKKLKDKAQMPNIDSRFQSNMDEHRRFFRFFSGFVGFCAVAWIVSALASLALIGSIIYFLIKAAGTF